MSISTNALLLTSRQHVLQIARLPTLFLFLSILMTNSAHKLPINSCVKPQSRHQSAIELMAFLLSQIVTCSNGYEGLYVIYTCL